MGPQPNIFTAISFECSMVQVKGKDVVYKAYYYTK